MVLFFGEIDGILIIYGCRIVLVKPVETAKSRLPLLVRLKFLVWPFVAVYVEICERRLNCFVTVFFLLSTASDFML